MAMSEEVKAALWGAVIGVFLGFVLSTAGTAIGDYNRQHEEIKGMASELSNEISNIQIYTLFPFRDAILANNSLWDYDTQGKFQIPAGGSFYPEPQLYYTQFAPNVYKFPPEVRKSVQDFYFDLTMAEEKRQGFLMYDQSKLDYAPSLGGQVFPGSQLSTYNKMKTLIVEAANQSEKTKKLLEDIQ